ncbi:SPOR domain-containing protein [Flavobacterium okayamense]|uniref:SPOR domain-containing protein n=1 Tax=Flavobacterium okayamense TaxID=2830782 RepID=A0ABM7S2W7_9FLAO|nr:SPOR domain-containing protein [Flavobacterium okayamense]BCY27860.1 hypothetical protein KK2020170_07280 [Flavobacterium okayamense]
MMLDNYISDLLYRYQCVTVPGFGAFVAETVPAQVNGSAATFLPPRKIITFNSNIKNNDGLLANHIAANENVSFEKATEMIAQKVASWNYELDQRNALIFDKIGTINVNGEEKNLVFEPANTTNFLVSSFGLSQFVSPEVKREVLKQEVEVLEEKAPIIFTPERKKNNFAFVKYAAAIAVLGTVGLFGYKMHYDQQVAEQTLVVQKNVQDKLEAQIQQATFFIETPNVTAVELPVVEEKLPYHLIAGAFRSEENAEKALQMLIDQGFKAQKLEKNKYDLYPVAYGSFATLEEAEMEKQKLKSEVDAEAWLLID